MISLKKICLNLIVQEFERFHFAYLVSKDRMLQRNLEFLQRKYSSKLAAKLREESILKEEYLEFLINFHLKCLKEWWFIDCRTSMKDVIFRLPNLTEISCWETDDEVLENVAKFCPNIVEIYAPSYQPSHVSDTGLKYFWKNENGKLPCPKLKELSINSSSITDESLIQLIQNLPSLEKIDNKNVSRALYSHHKEDFHDLEKLPTYNLVQLDLFNHSDLSYYTDILKLCITVCPRLKSVRCRITDKEQLNLFNNINLEEVDLHILESIANIDINNFLKNNGCNLVSLNASNCIISVNTLADSCPKLEYLEISNFTFSSDHDNPQTIFNCLIDCRFSYITIDNTTYKSMHSLLSSSPNIEDLDLSFCDIGFDAKTCNSKFCKKYSLKYVRIFDCFFIKKKSIIDIILSCPSLKIMRFEICNLTRYERNALIRFGKRLPNKPDIMVF